MYLCATKITIFFYNTTMQYPKLNYPAIHLRARRTPSGKCEVFDAIRGRWLVLTPEEWVRRHVVAFLVSGCGFSAHSIAEEHPVAINGMAQRADIVVMDECGAPYIVVECKEPEVKIDGGVYAQAVRYNSVLGCRYVVITNGMETYCYEVVDGAYVGINHFPTAK